MGNRAICALLLSVSWGSCAPSLGAPDATAVRPDAEGPDAQLAAETEPPPPGVRFPPALENVWELRNGDTGIPVWETDITYDPAAGYVVQHGAHPFHDYVQSSYTRRIDTLSGDSTWSLAPRRPQRRCIVELTYIDSLERTLTMFGGSSHGSLPQGRFNRDHTAVWRGDPPGPHLFDATGDRWEDTRTRYGTDLRSAHTGIAYDPGSDAVFALVEDRLVVYDVHGNTVLHRSLPEALHSTLGYGIALDPVHRRLVVFGGTGPQNYNWVGSADRAERWSEWVHATTWVYDIARDAWSEVEGPQPPRGMPMADHLQPPMIYHPPTRSVILMQVPLDRFEPDFDRWPASELWRFDGATMRWSRLPVEAPPDFPGLLAYDSNRDLIVLLGGGRDGARRRPATSRRWSTLRARTPGVRPPARLGVLRLHSGPVAEGVELRWEAEPGVVYEVQRAPIRRGLPGLYETVAEVSGRGRAVVPSEAEAAYRVRWRDDPAIVSHAAFTRPPRPAAPVARARADGRVELVWPASERGHAYTYRVYRAVGSELTLGPGSAAASVSEATWVDPEPQLSDGVARHYTVTAVDRHGVESGHSPVAHTFPDAPEGFTVDVLDDGRLRVRWATDDDPDTGGVEVFHIDEHVNTLGFSAERYAAYWDRWTRLTDTPIRTGEIVFEPPPGASHHYFYARRVNVLGQAGFRTDIASGTDRRFLGRTR